MKTVLLLATALTLVLANENATLDADSVTQPDPEEGETKCVRDFDNDGNVDDNEFGLSGDLSKTMAVSPQGVAFGLTSQVGELILQRFAFDTFSLF